MTGAKIIQQLWDRFQARDWAGAGELLADDLVVEWPVTGERIEGRANFVAVNAEYPEGWTIRVLRVVGDGEQVASEVAVPHETLGDFRVASFWTVRDGKITRATEYWTTAGSEKPPSWRSPYVTRIR